MSKTQIPDSHEVPINTEIPTKQSIPDSPKVLEQTPTVETETKTETKTKSPDVSDLVEQAIQPTPVLEEKKSKEIETNEEEKTKSGDEIIPCETIPVKSEILTASQKAQKIKQIEIQERKSKFMESNLAEIRKVDEALRNGKTLLSIECCVNCVEHQYCTHHKEEKYQEYFKHLKTEIEKLNPGIYVTKNHRVYKPQIGALEVVFNDQVVYSKLRELKWPNSEIVAAKLRDILEKDIVDKEIAEKEAVRKIEEEILRKVDEEKKIIEIEEKRIIQIDEKRIIEIEEKRVMLELEEKKTEDFVQVNQEAEQVHEKVDNQNKENNANVGFEKEVIKDEQTQFSSDNPVESKGEKVFGERDINQV